MTPIGERRVGRRAEQKRRWDRANYWRKLSPCPRCGNYKKKEAKVCRECNNPVAHRPWEAR